MKALTCASCGKREQLCNSVRIDEVQQPRFCTPCLITAMQTGEYKADSLFWIAQLIESNDERSLEILRKQLADKKLNGEGGKG